MLPCLQDVANRIKALIGPKADAVDEATMLYVGSIAAAMANLRQWEPDEWVQLVSDA